ncbi:CoA-binding protein [Tabrizicola oligotrophica]|uniref:CoA-binding protein n=1 Tax=Tabrizicola oligotrophica TaxID=2710650 RepID=A0A6M0QPL2_9RHOB|nr:CoA-binding protein [Tabrizicola oligotrophica]NEY89399.1 CoA-binding protein [Tabrizicola oligotrophica]
MSLDAPAEDARIARILTEVKTIALVGWSPKPDRPSHRVAAYLVRRGYRVIPVNPGQAGLDSGLGEVVRASLAEVGPVDMVDIFRRSEHVPPVVEAALASGAKVIWMQLGIENAEAAAKAGAAGMEVVMNRCPAIEIPRLGL